MHKNTTNTFKKKLISLLTIVSLMPLLLTSCGKKAATTDQLSSWTADAQAKNELTAYIEEITKEGSESYIPVKDRIAVFDLDGTLMCETYPRCFEYMVFVDYVENHPELASNEEIQKVAQEIVDTRWQEKPSGISTRQAATAAVAYTGIQPTYVIGTEYGYIATGQGDVADGDYTFQPTDKVVFDGQYF